MVKALPKTMAAGLDNEMIKTVNAELKKEPTPQTRRREIEALIKETKMVLVEADKAKTKVFTARDRFFPLNYAHFFPLFCFARALWQIALPPLGGPHLVAAIDHLVLSVVGGVQKSDT